MEKLPLNRVTWFQIPADNTERAWQFYGSVFNWSEEETWKNQAISGAILGTIEQRNEQFTCPRLIVRVEDINPKIEEIIKAGGKLVEPRTEIPEIGMVYAVFEDTEGNLVNIVGDLSFNG